MFTTIIDRLLAAVAPTVEAQAAYSFCSLGSESCRNHQRYILQTCFTCGTNDPRSCRKTSQGLIDYGGC